MGRMPISNRIASFQTLSCGGVSYGVLIFLSEGCSPVRARLHTRYAPVRRSPAKYCYFLLPLDLHVLGLSLAFILSQDQTLRCMTFFVLYLLGPALTVTLVTVATACSLTCDVRHFQYVNVLFVAFTWLRLERQPRCKVKWFFLILQEVFCFFFFAVGSGVAPFPKASAKVGGWFFISKFWGKFFLIGAGGKMG